jgi:hypothetical protein
VAKGSRYFIVKARAPNNQQKFCEFLENTTHLPLMNNTWNIHTSLSGRHHEWNNSLESWSQREERDDIDSHKNDEEYDGNALFSVTLIF